MLLPVPGNKLPPATSYRLHREQGDQAHRQAEIQNDEVQRGRDDCCDPDLSHPPAKDEADASESRVVQPNYILQTTAAAPASECEAIVRYPTNMAATKIAAVF